MRISELTTPALLIDAARLEHNLRAMAEALPGPRLRPHIKAHKCSALARRQAELGHRAFTCATIREMEGLAKAGLGDDLLLANEVLDARRLGALDARVTVAVDSAETIEAAARGGVREVLVDVNVGLPRCGCPPERAERARLTAESMERLAAAHRDVGGDVISAGGTGTYDLNTLATEIQAGSYALMDTSYAALGLGFEPAVSILATVISVSQGFAVADCGLKALGMDHGNPRIEGARVWFCSDEHVTFGELRVAIGERIRVWPAHVDPTVAYHERAWLVDGDVVLESWPIDLRGW